jgi:hypothetical protein
VETKSDTAHEELHKNTSETPILLEVRLVLLRVAADGVLGLL